MSALGRPSTIVFVLSTACVGRKVCRCGVPGRYTTPRGTATLQHAATPERHRAASEVIAVMQRHMHRQRPRCTDLVAHNGLLNGGKAAQDVNQHSCLGVPAHEFHEACQLLRHDHQHFVVILHLFCGGGAAPGTRWVATACRAWPKRSCAALPTGQAHTCKEGHQLGCSASRAQGLGNSLKAVHGLDALRREQRRQVKAPRRSAVPIPAVHGQKSCPGARTRSVSSAFISSMSNAMPSTPSAAMVDSWKWRGCPVQVSGSTGTTQAEGAWRGGVVKDS